MGVLLYFTIHLYYLYANLMSDHYSLYYPPRVLVEKNEDFRYIYYYIVTLYKECAKKRHLARARAVDASSSSPRVARRRRHVDVVELPVHPFARFRARISASARVQ